jgi:hypothetical protein
MKKLLLIAIVAASVTGCKKTYVCYDIKSDGSNGQAYPGLTEEQKDEYEKQYYIDIVGNPTSPIYRCQPE